MFLPALAVAGKSDDGSWKNYYNRQGSYCVDYPSRWISGEAFEGAGFFVKPGPAPHTKPLAEIDVGVLRAGHAGTTLMEEVQLHLDGLRKFELAEGQQLLEQRDILLSGKAALFSRDLYFDPQNGTPMIDETIFADYGGMLYRLELICRKDELERFEAVFQHEARSFRFDCPPHPVPRGFGSPRAGKGRSDRTTQPVRGFPHAAAN